MCSCLFCTNTYDCIIATRASLFAKMHLYTISTLAEPPQLLLREECLRPYNSYQHIHHILILAVLTHTSYIFNLHSETKQQIQFSKYAMLHVHNSTELAEHIGSSSLGRIEHQERKKGRE